MAAIDPEAEAYVEMAGGSLAPQQGRLQRAWGWAKGKIGYNPNWTASGAWEGAWDAVVAQKLVPEGTPRGSWGRMLWRNAWKGGVSSVVPIGPVIPHSATRAGRGFMSALPQGTAGALRGVGRAAARGLGPAMWAWRMGTEIDPRNGPFQGGGLFSGAGNMIDKGIRITGEEVGYGIAFGAGMPIGAAIGGALGTVVAPGVGTAVGMVVGAAIGFAGGYALSKAWNFAVDVAEAPMVMANRGWSFLVDKGRRAKRLELGGQISAGNRSFQAATMRQAALGEIYRSGVNQRSILGREAAYMHLR